MLDGGRGHRARQSNFVVGGASMQGREENTDHKEGEKWWHPSGLGMRLQMLSFTKVSNPGRKTGQMEGKELSFGYVEFEGPVRQSRKV